MIFLDSTFILALMFEDQKKHERAKEIYQLIANETKIINNTILMEILNSIKPPSTRQYQNTQYTVKRRRGTFPNRRGIHSCRKNV